MCSREGAPLVMNVYVGKNFCDEPYREKNEAWFHSIFLHTERMLCVHANQFGILVVHHNLFKRKTNQFRHGVSHAQLQNYKLIMGRAIDKMKPRFICRGMADDIGNGGV